MQNLSNAKNTAATGAIEVIGTGETIKSPVKRRGRRDALTGLHDHNALLVKLQQIIKRRGYRLRSYTLALLQLENFYEIQRWVGGDEANLLLREITQAARQCLPDTVCLYRCPQFEFAAILSDDSSINVSHWIDRLSQDLQKTAAQRLPPQLTFNSAAGLVAIDEHTANAEVLLARARHNLRPSTAKDRVEAIDNSAAPATRKTALHTLKELLRSNALQLHYQASLYFNDDHIQSFDVRCNGVDSPYNQSACLIIETASRNALGEVIDRWVIQNSLKQLVGDNSGRFCLTVNLTLNSLVSIRFLRWLQAIANRFPTAIPRFSLQISELDVLSAQHHIARLADACNDIGIKLCLSHFGCTPKPLRYLPLLPNLWRVSLDRSLLVQISEAGNKQEEVRNIVGALHDAGALVQATMIEQPELLPLLWELGVDLVQGHCLHAQETTSEFTFPPSMNLGSA